MSIQWFPGHMTRAKRELEASLKRVDMVIEIRDARCPLASKNPMIDTLVNAKPRLIVLNKRDMADPKASAAWVEALSADHAVLLLDAHHDDVRKRIVAACLEVMRPKLERWAAKGISARKLKAMVVGIPNVGKSTLINQLAKKHIMTTADRPGVTMALKWANVHPQLDLLDTPGILWPKFDDPATGLILALSGAIHERVLSAQDLAYHAFSWLNTSYPQVLEQEAPGMDADRFFAWRQDRYKDSTLERSYERFLRDLKHGRLGPLTFEHPNHMA